jgi:hypothetical protein
MKATAISMRAMPAPAFRWTAVLCALAIWLLGLLTVSPQLHAALHSDANHQDHSCAVTLFSHGVEEGTGVMAGVSAPELFATGSCLVQPVSPVAGVQHRLPPGCGPPLG